MEELRSKLSTLKTADMKAISLLEDLFVPVNFKRNLLLSSNLTGISAANLYYISNGLVKGVISGLKNEYCLWIINQGFIVPGSGFLTGIETNENIEVLAETRGYSLNLLRADTIARNNINMYRMLLEIYEETLLEGRKREIMLRMKKAADRYKYFHKNYPTLSNRLTLEQQAEYLHIDRKYFYNIRN
ncbi:hypothetical protein H8S90_24300 [Olivibacter sp. SDN3]|uniref:hypothetical protein n=1 Tax=Olivibacter sp. SDN3 TaxID=2764720 RepID=UPI0016510D70|nr:hypothetical protein [Olivibacter sp. SDN3]QNL49790.1 hypothetical protein H8S90_24300 [Olivibacter sp. SDN3]